MNTISRASQRNIGPIFEAKLEQARTGKDLADLQDFLAEKILEVKKRLEEGRVLPLEKQEEITRERNLRHAFVGIHTGIATEEEKLKIFQWIDREFLAYLYDCYTTLYERRRAVELSEKLNGEEALTDDAALALWKEKVFPSAQREFDEMRELARCARATRQALEEYGGKIEAKVEVQNLCFYLGPIRRTHSDYLECLFFCLKDGVIYPRLAYKSSSGGEWRVSVPYALREGLYLKGLHSYTVENKPCLELEQMLYRLESKATTGEKGLETVDRIGLDGMDDESNTYPKEIHEGRIPKGLEELCRFTPEYCFRKGNFSEEMFDPQLIPDGFIPQFGKGPIKILRRDTEKQGRVILELYEHRYDGEEFSVWMRRDEEGWVKPERIMRKGVKVTTYGTYDEVLELGPLACKPFEYLDRTTALNPDRDWDDRFRGLVNLRVQHNPKKPVQVIVEEGEEPLYGDVRPMLARLKFNQAYKPNVWPLSNTLKDAGIPFTPELERLVNVNRKSQGSEAIKREILAILQSPGTQGSITLRGLLLLFSSCAVHFTATDFPPLLDEILNQFKGEKGELPNEHSLYAALYREVLKGWKTRHDNQDRKGKGQASKTVIPEARTHLATEPEKKVLDLDGITDPDYIRYAQRWKVLSVCEKID